MLLANGKPGSAHDEQQALDRDLGSGPHRFSEGRHWTRNSFEKNAKSLIGLSTSEVKEVEVKHNGRVQHSCYSHLGIAYCSN